MGAPSLTSPQGWYSRWSGLSRLATSVLLSWCPISTDLGSDLHPPRRSTNGSNSPNWEGLQQRFPPRASPELPGCFTISKRPHADPWSWELTGLGQGWGGRDTKGYGADRDFWAAPVGSSGLGIPLLRG
ncbi:hypothetical protein DSO57_1038835 [Entomophthora muscae]|uniref:Uncharacterized protein n=1 Tax=Entomophthora muscae TaxID=34485 RepID=A0ACC2SBI9_9FUNG|nr:hypothetical protein DSO57_1038835 [Entomophthora muscae]